MIEEAETRPCWICGLRGGELFPSANGDPPFHNKCVDRHKAETFQKLTDLIDFVESDLQPWHVKAWRRFMQWWSSLK